ncbi:MAG: cupin domain-containing protein [Pseudomonadota bacterium]
MEKPVAVMADSVTPTTRPSLYPEPFAALMANRVKRRLGDVFGLSNFGVNLTTIAPGGSSALRHAHSRQDEFIYVVSGHPTLHTDEGAQQLAPGMCAGFKAGSGNGHRLLNQTDTDATYLEIGDRSAGDEAVYPDDDLKAVNQDGAWRFFHKDGSAY